MTPSTRRRIHLVAARRFDRADPSTYVVGALAVLLSGVWYKLQMTHTREMPHTIDRAVVAVGDRGRILLPARIRRSLGLRPGDHLLAEVQADHSLRLVPRDVAARQDRGAFAQLRTESSLVDELIADRREEATREDR